MCCLPFSFVRGALLLRVRAEELERRSGLQSFLRAVDHGGQLTVFIAGHLDRAERHGDVLLAHAQEAANADDSVGN